MSDILIQFLQARSWDEARQIVEQQHAILLAETTLRALDSLIGFAEQEGSDTSYLKSSRDLLQACREQGIEKAFANAQADRNQLQESFVAAADAYELFTQTGDIDALNEAISIFTEALESELWDADIESIRPITENQLLACLMNRFQKTHEEGDLQWALSLSEHLLETSNADDEYYPMFVVNRATILAMAYERYGKSEDLHESIAVFEGVLNQITGAEAKYAGAFFNLAGILCLRFDQCGDVEGFDRTIDLLRKLESQLEGDQLRYVWQSLLGLLRARNGAGDLDEVVRLERQLGLLVGSRRGLAGLAVRAEQSRQRFAATGNLSNLDQAIELFEQALAETSESSNSYAAVLNNLGGTYSMRYHATNNALDLDRSIDLFERVYEHVPEGTDDRYYYGVNVGLAVLDRYHVSHVAADLDRSVKLFEEAVAHTSARSPELPNYLNSFGIGLSERWKQVGNLNDLDRALKVWQDALAISQEESSQWCGILWNLCLGLQDRYGKTGSKNDVEQALSYCEQLIRSIPHDSPSNLEFMEELVRQHFLINRNLGRINEALATWKSAIAKRDYVSQQTP